MPFKNVFERRVNENMQEAEAGRAPPPEVVDADMEMKKQIQPPSPDKEAQAQDGDWSDKKDQPPRFSTLFSAAPPQPPRQFESYPEPKRKSGVFLPTPVFTIIAVILLFESTVLFAYTVIGLYNNLPVRLVPGAAVCACEGIDRQPTVNIAPNFIMPQAQAPQTVTVFGTGSLPDLLPPSTSTTSSSILSTSTSSSSMSSVAATSQAAAAASDILGMLTGLATATATPSSSRSVAVVTVTPASTVILSEVQPTPSAVKSTLLLTVNAAGSTLSPDPTTTATSATATATT
ncbi:hypothetical protein LTR36_009665 [Oleoguttula mirabilis]|uniref:Uncharacterized protein n=1 Tax=Oleoguttula mirabilis TaxID=1507867 RepID=A0AAV9J636_9PEZI|nr:hypothetical protein LTR36_009665 [Oleoguttula mirabilis]